MRFTSSLLFAAGALALPKHDCLSSNSADIAALSDCGDQAALASCLSSLGDASVESCYVDAGCPPAAAAAEAQLAIDRCARPGDLRRRVRAALDDPSAPATAAVPVAELFAARTLAPRTTSLECFTTSTVQSKTCPVSTNDGKPTTQECFSTDVAKSECAPGLYCTTDPKGADICMELDDDLGIDGIIIAIVFAVAIAVGIGYLTFMCCRDKREQKRLAAKAEATALARAATKKKRAQEVRTPLMRQGSGQGQPGGDPFADGSRL